MAETKNVKTLLGNEGRRPWYVRAAMVAVVAAAAGGWYYWQARTAPTAVSVVTAGAVRGNLTVTVTADGTLNPMRTVTLGSELSGIVREVLVDVNDKVAVNQTVIELDTRNLEAKVASAEAALMSAHASLAESEATLKEAELRLKRMQELNRLSEGRMPSATELEQQQATVATARASVEVSRSQIADAEANLSTARTDLGKASIKSPIDGVVLARSVEPGYAVAASLQAVELLTLATDLRELELRVDVDEADVGVVKQDQTAYFTVSAYPDRRFPAKLKKVAYGSTETENVVTYTAYLDVANPDMLLRPGMTASATILTAERDNVLLVPNSALRFTPRVDAKSSSGSQSMSLMMRGPHDPKEKSAKELVQYGERDRTIYVLRAGEAVPVTVRTGLTDGTRTEVISGELAEGDAVIVDQRKASTR